MVAPLSSETLMGGFGDSSLQGGDGDDRIFGGPGADTLRGGKNSDTISGGKGNDLILGGGGSDVLQGGDGDDTLRGGNGADTLVGGAGADTFRYVQGQGGEFSTTSTFDLSEADAIQNFESGIDKIQIDGWQAGVSLYKYDLGSRVATFDIDANGSTDLAIKFEGVGTGQARPFAETDIIGTTRNS